MTSPPERVLVVGAGLLGASVGLALRRVGVHVHLQDADPAALRMAVSLGAGVAGRPPGTADLAVVAVPPAATAGVVAGLLHDRAAEVVTDVASVKGTVAAEVTRLAPAEAARYVGGHPMAGRELSGPTAARSDLFDGRSWVVCPPAGSPAGSAAGSRAGAVETVSALASAVGAVPVLMAADDHDRAVALVSHAPHLVASLVAGRLADAPHGHVTLAGPGIADVTRVAAGDPRLWRDILTANAEAVRAVLLHVRDDLDAALAALDAPGAAAPLDPLLRAGNAGRARLPGKHGGSRTEFRLLPVVIDDRPGQLGRLFGDVGDAGANIEDVRIEHSPGQPVGLVELAVRPEQADGLVADLRGRGWTVHA